MSKDEQPQTEETLAGAPVESLPTNSQGTKPKRDWVEWGKTAGKASDDFMPGRIEDLPRD